MGHKESVKDADRMVGHIYEYPGVIGREWRNWLSMPTDEFHPTWVCADALTMREHAENRMHIIKVVFVASLT